jgi:hypothetical protein
MSLSGWAPARSSLWRRDATRKGDSASPPPGPDPGRSGSRPEHRGKRRSYTCDSRTGSASNYWGGRTKPGVEGD